MAEVRQRLLAVLFLSAAAAAAQRFYPDDPLEKAPPPRNVGKAQHRKLNEYYDFFRATFFETGERQPKGGDSIPARAVNTLGETIEPAWHTRRHYWRPMSIEALMRGPGMENAPAGPFVVVGAKTEGVTPGFSILDARGRRYLLKVDPRSNPELATGADVIGSKFFYALGYNVPENYIVYFNRSQLSVSAKAIVTDERGRDRAMNTGDLEEILRKLHRDGEDRYRAVASLFIPGEIIGPFRFYSVRKDDPNDVVPHEHRRDLRGLFVFCAWLNHSDTKSLNTLDSIVEEDGRRFIRHHLIDFGAILGSDSFQAKTPRGGNQYLFAWTPATIQLFSLGLWAPAWMFADYPDLPAVGRLESKAFDPEKWVPNYPIAPFRNRLPDDEFWAARQVMAFTDEQIRAVVRTAEYSDPEASAYIARALIERRDKIGRTYFAKVLPLDRFRIEKTRLRFDDLAVLHGFEARRDYIVGWSRFDNASGTLTPAGAPAANALQLPGFLTSTPGAYAAAAIQAGEAGKGVTVYLRNRGGTIEVVGAERKW